MESCSKKTSDEKPLKINVANNKIYFCKNDGKSQKNEKVIG